MSDPYDFCIATIASSTIESMRVGVPGVCAALIVFDPPQGPERGRVFSNAEADQLIPVLRATLERLESGTLVRLPVTDGVRWMDADLAEETTLTPVEDPADTHMAELFREPEE